MWYLLAFGGGLALGLVFLFWALAERGKRTDAEARLAQARTAVKEQQALVATYMRQAQESHDDLGRATQQLAVLRVTIAKLHDRLGKCQDPATVRAWLEAELGDVDL